MGIICILVFFCSYVLIICLQPACGDMRSLVLARDDNVGGHCIWWVYTFFRQNRRGGCIRIFRQKNIRTKVMTLNVRMIVQASLMHITTFNVEHLRCWEHYSTFVGKNRRRVFFFPFSVLLRMCFIW